MVTHNIEQFWFKFNYMIDACLKTKSNVVNNINEEFKEEVVINHKRYFPNSEIKCLTCKSSLQKAIDELCLIRHEYERYTPQ